MELELRSFSAELGQDVGVVMDGCSVDHPESDLAYVGTARTLSPTCEIAGQRDNLSGVVQDGLRRCAQDPTSTDPFEQRNTDTAFELGQTLREGRGAHPNR